MPAYLMRWEHVARRRRCTRFPHFHCLSDDVTGTSLSSGCREESSPHPGLLLSVGVWAEPLSMGCDGGGAANCGGYSASVSPLKLLEDSTEPPPAVLLQPC